MYMSLEWSHVEEYSSTGWNEHSVIDRSVPLHMKLVKWIGPLPSPTVNCGVTIYYIGIVWKSLTYHLDIYRYIDWTVPDLLNPSCLQATAESVSISQLLPQMVPYIFWWQIFSKPSPLLLPSTTFKSPSSQSDSSSSPVKIFISSNTKCLSDNELKALLSQMCMMWTNLNMSELHHFRGVGSCTPERTERHNQQVAAHSQCN